MRPVLRPGLRLLQDPSGGFALVDRDRLYRLDDAAAALLVDLDGLLDEDTLLCHHPAPVQVAAWRRLRDAGVVVDVEAAARIVRAHGGDPRGSALHEANALVAHDPFTAEHRWRRRRAATVAVLGNGAVAGVLAGMLADAGVGAVLTCEAGPDADVTVLAHDHEPPTDVVERLMRDSRAHLPAGLRAAEGVVGPFVRPGATPCLRCVDLSRCAADPGWGALRERLSLDDAAARVTARPASSVVVSAVVALAAAEVLAQVEGRNPATLGATVSTSLHAPLPTTCNWPRQPACGCAWQIDVAAQEQWGA